MWEHLLDFVVTWAALALPALACASLLYERPWCERSLVLFGGFAGVTILGYVGFWAWLASPNLGIAWTVLALAAAGVVIRRRRRQALETLRDGDVWIPLLLMLLVGILYISLLHLFRTNLRIDALSAARYMLSMPVDNELPGFFAERLIRGQSPLHLFNEWLSSDRPPLQVGVMVFNAPIARAIGAPMGTGMHAAGVWFQLLWLPAMWATLRRLGFDSRHAAALAAVTAILGLTMFHSIYLWPKLGGGAFPLAAFVLYARPQVRGVAVLIGVAALSALGWLSHGATVYSLLALGMMGLFWKPRPSLRAAAAGLVTFAALALPWTAYQKLYDPPGNRLVKWHVGGVIAIDKRGVLETIEDQYRLLGWDRIVAAKKENFLTLIAGFDKYTFALDQPRERRSMEWYFFFRSLGVWNVALLAAPIALLRRRRPHGASPPMIGAVSIWLGLTLIVWCLIQFGPPMDTRNHQGSLAANLAMHALAYALAWRISPWLLGVLAAASVVTSAITWIPATVVMRQAPLSPAAAMVASLSALAMAGLLAHQWRTNQGGDMPAPPRLH